MSILNVDKIQPIGGGSTITVDATDIQASTGTITANSYTGVDNTLKVSIGGTEYVRTHSTGQVSIGSTFMWRTDTVAQVYGKSPDLSLSRFNDQFMIAGNETSGAINTGAGIQFFGHDGVQERGMAYIRGLKENGTSGNRASYLAFATRPASGTLEERLRITGIGSVGINEDQPKALLHVATDNGQTLPEISASFPLIVTKNSNSGIAIIAKNDAKSILAFGDTDDADRGKIQYVHTSGTDADSMQFLTAGTERLRIESNGNLKVTTGTQYMGYKVHKADGGLVAELVGFASDNDEGGLSLWDGGNKKTQIVSSGYSWFMGGNVGINTTTPTQRLVSYADSGYPIVGNGPSNSIALNNAGVIVFGTKDVASYASGSFDATDFTFKISGTERVRITSNGKVNIGTGELDQTDRMLNVYGGRARISGITAGNSFEIYASNTGGQSYGILCQAGTGSSDINTALRNTNGVSLFRVRGDGVVFVGSSTVQQGSTSKLEVMGTLNNSYPGYSYPIMVSDDAAYNSSAGPGGGIGFSFKQNSGGAYAQAGGIRGIKENTTDGNYASALTFYTRLNGSGTTERLRITSRGYREIRNYHYGPYAFTNDSWKSTFTIGDPGDGRHTTVKFILTIEDVNYRQGFWQGEFVIWSSNSNGAPGVSHIYKKIWDNIGSTNWSGGTVSYQMSGGAFQFKADNGHDDANGNAYIHVLDVIGDVNGSTVATISA